MPKLITIALTQSTAQDKEGIISLLQLIEEMGLPAEAFEREDGKLVAAGPITFFAAISWSWPVRSRRGDHELEVSVTTAGGKRFLLGKINGSIQSPKRRARVIFNIKAFPVDAPGVYVFSLLCDGQELGSVPVDVGITQEDGKTHVPGLDWEDEALVDPAPSSRKPPKRKPRSRPKTSTNV